MINELGSLNYTFYILQRAAKYQIARVRTIRNRYFIPGQEHAQGSGDRV